MKIRFRISPKKDNDNLQEVLLTIQPFVNGKVITMRAKSGVSINGKYFDVKDGIKDLTSRKFTESPELIFHRSQSEKLQSLVAHIKAGLDATDKDRLTSDWLKNTVKAYYNPQEQIKSGKSIYELAQEYIEKKSLSKSSIILFRTIIRAVSRYERYIRAIDRKRKDFTFDVNTVTKNDIENFLDYLRNEYQLAERYPELFSKLTSEYPNGFNSSRDFIDKRGGNTIITEASRLKTFFKWLNKQKVIHNKPFEGIEMNSGQYGTPIYITLEERDRIAATEMPSKNLEIHKDIFIFQCLVGCRVSDLMKFTKDNIVDGFLVYTPQKTHKEGGQPVQARVPLVGKAIHLIEKYKGVDKKGRLFPFPCQSKQNYNYDIKTIFALAGVTRIVEVRNSLSGEIEMKHINEVASSHMARRTFIGNLYNNGIPDPNIIGAMSGHVEGSTAFARYRKIEDDTLRNAVQYLK